MKQKQPSVGSMSLFSLCLHSYVLSSSGKLEHAGCGSVERNKQQGRSGCEAGTYFMALDVSEKCQSKIHWPQEHSEIAAAFRRSKHGELCSVVCIYCICFCVCVCVCVYVCMYILLL